MSGTEFERIARYFVPLAGEAALGLSDDAALWIPPHGKTLVLTVDQMVEGVHFLPDDPPGCVARKLLRRNLSDLAAMGAEPVGYLLTTALRAEMPEAWLAEFAEGLAWDQKRYGIALFGGDSTSTPGPLMASVTMIGQVAPGEALRRSGALVGDAVFVTGAIGDAMLGLEAARGKIDDFSGYFRERRLLPEPRIGLRLAGLVHAAVDVSDGLIQDLGHICRNSGVGAAIEAGLVPASDAARAAGEVWLEARLTGGDDYELILAAPPDAEMALREACAPVPITRIGYFSDDSGKVMVRDRDGQKMNFARTGWRHF